MSRVERVIRSELGASAVEYALVAAAIAAVLVATAVFFGAKVSAEFSQTCTAMSQMSGPCS